MPLMSNVRRQTATGMKQLERLLFLQGSRCFFCGETIPIGEASIEHLVATSNGGATKSGAAVEGQPGAPQEWYVQFTRNFN